MKDELALNVAGAIDVVPCLAPLVAPTIDTNACAQQARKRWPWPALASGLLHAAALVGLGWWALPEIVPPASLAIDAGVAEELPQLEHVPAARPLETTALLAASDEATPAVSLLTAAIGAVELAQPLSPLPPDALQASNAALAASAHDKAGQDRAGRDKAGTADTRPGDPPRKPIKFFDAPLYPAQRSFVFVVDASGSMHGARFDRARRELMATLEQLEPTQRFYVVFFNEYDFPQFHPQRTREYIAATPDNLRRVQGWINSLRAAGDTHPMSALRKGLELRPDALYLLSDGAFELRTLSLIRQFNKHGTTIHTIGLEDPAGETLLKAIAEENAGGYHFVK